MNTLINMMITIRQELFSLIWLVICKHSPHYAIRINESICMKMESYSMTTEHTDIFPHNVQSIPYSQHSITGDYFKRSP